MINEMNLKDISMVANEMCNLDNDNKVSFVIRVGWYTRTENEEYTIYYLNKSKDPMKCLCLVDDSKNGDDMISLLSIHQDSITNYFGYSGKSYILFDEQLTAKHRGKEWYEVKKEIYESTDYPWDDKDEFLANYNNSAYIAEASEPTIYYSREEMFGLDY